MRHPRAWFRGRTSYFARRRMPVFSTSFCAGSHGVRRCCLPCQPRCTPMQLRGFHHLTAITGDIANNRKFFTDTLGMRLVKKTVNQDDVSAYHLFYADGRGSPGSDVTFFDWPAPRERRGTSAI